MRFDPFSAEFLADPYPRYDELRRTTPCHREASRDLWMVSRHVDVLAVIRDPARFSSAEGAGYLRVDDPERGGILISTDPPRHTAIRRYVQPSFSPEAMARLSAFVDARADRIVERAVALRTIDAVAELAEPLPVAVSAELLGFPTDESEKFAGWSDAIFQTMGPMTQTEGERLFAVIGGLLTMVVPVVREQRYRPDGLAATIMRDTLAGREGALTEGEAVSLILSVFAAGIDTTIHAVANGLAALASNPAQWERLRASPELVAPAVEEMLRFDAPIQAFFRTATSEVMIAGTVVPAGGRVMALFGSANRDPDRFDEPDTFRIDREPSPSGQLAFGAGIHLCLGAPLARLEMQALLRALVRHVRRIEPAGEPVRRDRSVVRGYASLPLSLVG